MSTAADQQSVRPWGSACGIVIGGLAMVVCVFRGVSPLEIVLRTFTVCIVTAIVVRGLIVVFGHLVPDDLEDGDVEPTS
jgi:hypothetical protein